MKSYETTAVCQYPDTQDSLCQYAFHGGVKSAAIETYKGLDQMKHCLTHAAALALVGSIAMPAAADQTFSIRQDVPTLTLVDIGEEGSSQGDVLAFEAPFTGGDGASGEMHGIIITVSTPFGEGDPFHYRVAQIVVNFGDTNTLVIAGTAEYPNGQTEMTPGAPHVRAVIGGTGSFIGARGQMVTTRLDTGEYEHMFTLVD